MTKRGGPMKRPNPSSKNANEASDRERVASGDALVLDFLYYDAERVGSFLAQVDTGGHLKQVTEGDSVSKGKRRGHTFKAAMKIPEIHGVTTEGEGSLEYGLSPDESGTKTGQRTYDPFWTNARSFLDFLQEEDLISSDIRQSGMGQFVLQTGTLWLLDTKVIQAIISHPLFQALVAGSSEAQAKPLETQMLLAFLPILELGVQATLIGGEHTLWGTLRRESLSTSPEDLMLKHGAQVAGNWTVLGILDARPDQNQQASPSPFGGVAQMVVSLAEMRPHIGRPSHAFGITPLLIFREIAASAAEIRGGQGVRIGVVLCLGAVALVGALVSATAVAAYVPFNSQRELDAHERAEARSFLSRNRTATGQSMYDRMAACRFRIQWKNSRAEGLMFDVPALGAKQGDTLVDIYFDRPAADPGLAKDNLARWLIRGNGFIAKTGWAREIQFGPYPINKDGLSRC